MSKSHRSLCGSNLESMFIVFETTLFSLEIPTFTELCKKYNIYICFEIVFTDMANAKRVYLGSLAANLTIKKFLFSHK